MGTHGGRSQLVLSLAHDHVSPLLLRAGCDGAGAFQYLPSRLENRFGFSANIRAPSGLALARNST
jgi:hypothetical protein